MKRGLVFTFRFFAMKRLYRHAHKTAWMLCTYDLRTFCIGMGVQVWVRLPLCREALCPRYFISYILNKRTFDPSFAVSFLGLLP